METETLMPHLMQEVETSRLANQLGFTDEQLYDDSPESDDMYGIQLNEGLTEDEIKDAMSLTRMMRGVMIVTGPPGSGKDLFANTLAWKIKRYFKGRRVLRDDKPRRNFGAYIPINEEILSTEFVRIGGATAGILSKETRKKATEKLKEEEEIASEWANGSGKELLTGGVLYLTEFKRYFHNRRAGNPMGVLLGHIVSMWRHFDLLIIGTTPKKREIDAISLLPYVTHEVRCDWMASREGTTRARVNFVRYVGTSGCLEMSGKPLVRFVNGIKPIPALNGDGYFSLYNSKNREWR
jgi:hypothetical protein